VDRSVLARQRSENRLPYQLSFGTLFLSMEISLIATAITGAQHAVRNEIAILRYDLQLPQKAHWILATRITSNTIVTEAIADAHKVLSVASSV
jgi:hypothetical protein